MADDKGGGLGGLVFHAVEAAKDAAGDIVTELESFTKFQQRVDQLVKDLKGSPADSKKLGNEPLARAQFGGGEGAFKEASGLYTSYQTVITDLENLSKLLSDSIEGMGIAVMISHQGYENLDEDVKRRVQRIRAETTEHYGGPYVPDSRKVTKQDGGADGHGGGASQPSDEASGGAI
ncbi:hypothetical protein ACIREE_36265 [Streptomyces sp. NPDC102467]|uniref:hypothetical protein n=1 Tax=Streptomyces sp. NPDC102467 TaxID=3366179 RepID=UPI00382ED8B6